MRLGQEQQQQHVVRLLQHLLRSNHVPACSQVQQPACLNKTPQTPHINRSSCNTNPGSVSAHNRTSQINSRHSSSAQAAVML
jgi:hypothetical protein